MKTQTDKTQEPQHSITPRVASESSNGGTAQLKDNRTSSLSQRKLRSGMDSMDNSNNPIQRKNKTGLPDNLKSGIENLSGYSMDDVKVHYNSNKPAQLQAHAYAQGTDIHLAPGQEKHLPHEAWHVVQQKQGRVKPTRQLKSKVNINDNAGLEREADVMGAKALQMKVVNKQKDLMVKCAGEVTQMKIIPRIRKEGECVEISDNRLKKVYNDTISWLWEESDSAKVLISEVDNWEENDIYLNIGKVKSEAAGKDLDWNPFEYYYLMDKKDNNVEEGTKFKMSDVYGVRSPAIILMHEMTHILQEKENQELSKQLKVLKSDITDYESFEKTWEELIRLKRKYQIRFEKEEYEVKPDKTSTQIYRVLEPGAGFKKYTYSKDEYEVSAGSEATKRLEFDTVARFENGIAKDLSNDKRLHYDQSIKHEDLDEQSKKDEIIARFHRLPIELRVKAFYKFRDPEKEPTHENYPFLWHSILEYAGILETKLKEVLDSIQPGQKILANFNKKQVEKDYKIVKNLRDAYEAVYSRESELSPGPPLL